MPLNWESTQQERELAHLIAVRFCRMTGIVGAEISLLNLEMDILCCHLNGNPLRLGDLLKADNYEFTHDVFGIYNSINRRTGELEDCFSPRYSKSEE